MDGVARVLRDYPRIYFACHTRHVRDATTGEELSARQASILDHLDELEPMTLGGLAGHMGVTPSTMSIAVDRLEQRGFVRRERASHDRRLILLRLTASGARIRQANSVLDPDRVAEVLAVLDDGDRERALAGLELLAIAANETMKRRTDS
jgi:DNA-binding MarR family transcriptional regulator